METKLLKVLVLGVAITAQAVMVNAQEEPANKPPLSAEDQSMQAKMMAYGTTNEHHEFLKTLEGRWNAKVSFWMDPAGQPEVSEGTSDAKVIMNGRFLEQNFNGTAMGQPFEGRSIMGYDNLKKEYVNIWFDSMATGIMTSEGQYDPAKKVLTAEGSMSCPITQEAHRWVREVMTFKDADNYTYESFMKDKDGKEFRAMEILYSRAK